MDLNLKNNLNISFIHKLNSNYNIYLLIRKYEEIINIFIFSTIANSKL